MRWPDADGMRWPDADGMRWLDADGMRWLDADGMRWPDADGMRWLDADGMRWLDADGMRCPTLILSAMCELRQRPGRKHLFLAMSEMIWPQEPSFVPYEHLGRHAP